MENSSIEFRWLAAHAKELRRYAGKHIAVVGSEVVAVGDTFKEVFEKGKEKSGKIPLVGFIPRKNTVFYKIDKNGSA